MKKKGQLDIGIGLLLVTAITLIVGVILFQTIAQQVGDASTTVALANYSLGVATNGTAIYMNNHRFIDTAGADFHIINGTTGIILTSSNYTLTNNVIDPSNGELSIRIVPSGGVGYAGAGSAWFISGTAQPDTYIADSGARSVAAVISIMFALAIAVVALTPTLRSKIIDMVR